LQFSFAQNLIISSFPERLNQLTYLLDDLGHFSSIESLLPIFPLCNSSLGDIREDLFNLKDF
jgi:hypothetical protein